MQQNLKAALKKILVYINLEVFEPNSKLLVSVSFFPLTLVGHLKARGTLTEKSLLTS